MNGNRSDYRQWSRQRVRWAEVDMQRIVFNAHYLMYFDTAMAEYWRALALPYEATLAVWGGDLYLKKASVEYAASARYDDVIDTGMRLARVGNTSMRFDGVIFRGTQLLVTAELTYVFAEPSTQRPAPVPEALRAVLNDFEVGAAMHTGFTGDWQTVADEVRTLRAAVFVQELGMAAGWVEDAHDAAYVHAVVRNRLGKVVAAGRLEPVEPGVVRVGRLAVDRVLRGAGFARLVVRALTAEAAGRNELVLAPSPAGGSET